MVCRVVWHRLAEHDLDLAVQHIGSGSPAAAERLIDAVGDTVAFLLENPGAGPIRGFHARRARDVQAWAVRGFHAYSLFYWVTGEDLEVVRFLHGAQDWPRLLGAKT